MPRFTALPGENEQCCCYSCVQEFRSFSPYKFISPPLEANFPWPSRLANKTLLLYNNKVNALALISDREKEENLLHTVVTTALLIFAWERC